MSNLDLFESAAEDRGGGPLAARMRPQSLLELVGQKHLLAEGAPLRRLVEGDDRAVSLILYGPPGTGKTTIAHLVSKATGRRFAELSAVTAGVKDVRAVIEDARRRLGMGEPETVLFVDEVHRFSKTQQDALLPAVENGWVVLVAATTENPHFAIVSPLLSRSLLMTLKPLDDEDVADVVERAVVDERGLASSVSLTEEARDAIVRLAGGDARRALT
ncbi:MAG: AAA family ATPase, partial [Actinomycetes bacterium]